jgi:hypothetical protein
MNPAATAAPPGNAGNDGGGASAPVVPYLVGVSQKYREAPFFTFTATLGATQQTINPVPQITPGNFLSGIILQITATGGSLGTSGALTTDGALAILTAMSLVDTGGGEILYPMGSLEMVFVQKYLHPWKGDPQLRAGYSNTINPLVTLRYAVEVRDTLGALVNTDARAQYRANLVLAPLASLATGGTVVAPSVTVKGYLDAWPEAQATDLAGNPIDPVPPGVDVSRLIQHETFVVNGGNNTLKFNLTGNEIRGLILIPRAASGARTDFTDANCGPIRFRLDNQVIWTMFPSQIIEEMAAFYQGLIPGYLRDTGLFVIPCFRDPGNRQGTYWLQTIEQSLLQLEFVGADIPAGSLEVIYDQLAVPAGLDPAFEGL